MFDYTSAQFAEQYRSIKQWVTAHFSRVRNPKAFILGGQPGAGKTSDNGARTVRISAEDRPRAEQLIAPNAAGDRLKK